MRVKREQWIQTKSTEMENDISNCKEDIKTSTVSYIINSLRSSVP